MTWYDKIWNFIVGEPTATIEMLRQVLPFVIIMGWVHLTDVQTAQLFMAISAFLAWLNRRSVTPNSAAGMFVNPRNLPVILLIASSLWLASCALTGKPAGPVDAQTAHYAAQVEDGVVAVQQGFLNAYKAGQVTFDVADPVMTYAKQATVVAVQLSNALKVYHAATSADAQALAAADVRKALGDLESLVGKMLGVKVPSGFLDVSIKLIGAVRDAVAAIRSLFPAPVVVGPAVVAVN